MVYIAIAVLTLILYIVPLYVQTARAQRDAYQWWPLPWLALIYVAVAFVLFRTVDITSLLTSLGTLIGLSLITDEAIEVSFALLCQLLWLLISFLLKKLHLHEKWIPWFRKAFAPEDEAPERVLPFPYFVDYEGKVRARVGKLFYRWLLSAVVVIVAVVHALYFMVMAFVEIPFYLISAFALLGLIPLIEYVRYLLADVPEEKGSSEGGGRRSSPSDLEKLWKLYVETFQDYSVAWRKKNHQTEDIQSNKDEIAHLLEQMIKGKDGFLENCDITQAFIQMESLFNWEEQNGRLVLVIFDMPNHFKKKENCSCLQEATEVLRRILRTELAVYDEYSSDTVLTSSIVVASLAVLSRRNLREEWLRRIGLVVVVNLQDMSVANLYECRRFSYLLNAVNKDYQMLFITSDLRDVDSAMRNIWLTGDSTEEKRLRQTPRGDQQFFIGYHFENYISRYKRLMTSLPSEALPSISEMAPIALSYKVGDKHRIITPVHFFDLAYTNIIEGKEELSRFYTSKWYLVRREDLNKHIHHHLLPLEVIDEEQMFAVIFDQDNNAPAAYSRWCHLGTQENFSIVISRPYLFRDYFNANHAFFMAMPFVALQPQLSKSRVTLAVILLSMLQKSGIEEQQLRGMLHVYYENEELRSLATVVKQLFTIYFSNDLASRLRTTNEVVFDGSQYRHQTFYNLDYSDSIMLSYLEYVTVRDESDNVLFTIIKDLIPQNFDIGQTHSFLGRPYIIQGYEEDNKVLRVRAVHTPVQEVVFYRPVQRVTLQGERRPIKGMNCEPQKWSHELAQQPLSLSLEGFETQVSVQVRKWYEFYRYTIRDCTYKELKPEVERKYDNGRVLKVTMHYLKKEEYERRIDDIRRGLQLLIYEALQSIFPHHAQYLIVASKGEGDPSLPWIFNEFFCDDEEPENTLSFFFIEDAHIDLGLIGALSLKDNFGAGYLFRYIYDYLLWLTEGAPVGSGEFDEYHSDEKMDKMSFLKYGRDKLPEGFDIELLINFIRDFFCEPGKKVVLGVLDRQKHQDVFGTCDFCRKKMKNSEMQALDDGRMRCPECSEGAVDTNEQFQALCEEVKEAFKEHLGIDFSKIAFTPNFVSAVELHKKYGAEFTVTNGYDVRKLLGFAMSNVDHIYVENGYKVAKTYGIIAHELTHIWQFHDADFQKVQKTNGDLMEGLAVWTDLFLSEKHGSPDIESLRSGWLSRDDEYGRGLRFIMDNCPEDPYGYIRKKAGEI